MLVSIGICKGIFLELICSILKVKFTLEQHARKHRHMQGNFLRAHLLNLKGKVHPRTGYEGPGAGVDV